MRLQPKQLLDHQSELVQTRLVLIPMSLMEFVTAVVSSSTTPTLFLRFSLVRVVMALLLFKVVLLVPIKVRPRVWVLLLEELVVWKTESRQFEKVSYLHSFFDIY
jgi:hypothetical protein